MTSDLADATDLELVGLLRRDGRATYSQLAGIVGLSVASVKRRVDRLRAVGVITGFTVRLDEAKIGWAVRAFMEMRYTGRATPDDMLASLSSVPEVRSVFTVAGDPDVLVELRVRDHAHLQEVIGRLRVSGRAMGTKTLIVLGEAHQD